MTTTVKVIAHSNPAEVLTFPLGPDRQPVADGKWTSRGRVEPNTEGHFVVTASQDLMVRELEIGA